VHRLRAIGESGLAVAHAVALFEQHLAPAQDEDGPVEARGDGALQVGIDARPPFGRGRLGGRRLGRLSESERHERQTEEDDLEEQHG
jgi:hypothetical protein